ncbi:MAG: RIP metalloprotease RseP [Rubrobacter sp.]|nr:RIP metalloprotease RseP [Rubrobacter sp.]
MTILLTILGLIVLIAIHELGHMLTAKALGVHVEEFAIGFGPPIFKRKIGKTVYSFRLILLGGFAKMAGMSQKEEQGPETYHTKPPWRRALIIFAGPAVNFVAAIFILAGLFYVIGNPANPTNEVGQVQPESMAAEAGMQEGDTLVAFEGQQTPSWEAFTEAVNEREPGEAAAVTVERGGETVELSGELGASEQDPEQPLVGIGPEPGSAGPLEALVAGAVQTGQISVAYVDGLIQLVTGQINFFDAASGPVGIVAVSDEVASAGIAPYIQFFALISLILAIMNLLPILPLDGGHLLMIAVEKLRGRRVNEETMGKIAFVFIMLLITLMLVVTYSDVSRLISGEPFIPE